MVYFAQYESPVGRLLFVSNGQALTELRFGEKLEGSPEEDGVLRSAKLWLDGYFRGEVRPMDIPLAPEGTEFQKQVWQCLLEIPWGETWTYGQIAGKLGRKTMSAQAVGQAVGKNPIAILIPCHRIVGSGGKLTGYAWGIERKQWLLDHENMDNRRNHQ